MNMSLCSLLLNMKSAYDLGPSLHIQFSKSKDLRVLRPPGRDSAVVTWGRSLRGKLF